MPSRSASFLCTITIILVIGVQNVLSGCPWDAMPALPWSAWSSWPSKQIPATGSAVTIASGQTILYDLPSGSFASITIASGGSLIFANANVALQTNYIFVNYSASFLIGSSDCAFTAQATITLTGPKDIITSIGGFGNKGIMSLGTLEMWGNAPTPTWSKISSTIQPGGTQITLSDSVHNWKVGDSIVIASTDYYQELSEQRNIAAISGSTITLDRPVNFMHWGANNEYAEVGHLTRNILIQGDNTSDSQKYGGHVLAHNGSMKIFGVEFTRMGQLGMIGRYPLHWHVMGDVIGQGQFAKSNSYHNNYQRCMTIHGTSGVTAQDNVGFNVSGHCYFMEEGSETFNVWNHNLGIWVNPGTLIPSDSQPSIFWVTNPNNTLTNNVAVGGVFGYWFSLPLHPIGLTSYQTWVYPRFTPLISFTNNTAHSASIDGFHADDCLSSTGVTQAGCVWSPLIPPYTTSTQTYNTPQVRTIISGYTAYKCRQYGMWISGYSMTLTNSLLMDNGIGASLETLNNLVTQSTFIGETPNFGTPLFTKGFNDQGRSRPQIWSVDYPIHGYEVYDYGGNQNARGNTFINFTTNSVRSAGAVGARLDGFNILPVVSVAQSTLINSGAFAQHANSENLDGPKHIVIQDTDGSLTGTYGSYIVSNTTLLVSPSTCSLRADWGGFYQCQKSKDGYSQISVYNKDVSGTNFGTSSALYYRATWYQFGRPESQDPIMGAPAYNPVRTEYDLNCISRRGYLLTFPHPTPHHLRVELTNPAQGEWVVVALQYPATTTFTITRGYPNTPLTPVTSVAAVTPLTYYFSASQNLLYVMYMQKTAVVSAPAGFPYYTNPSDSYVDITASCGVACIPTVTNIIPPALADNEDVYWARMQGCKAGTNSASTGLGYIMYNPKNNQVTYNIYHNIGQATTATIYGPSGQVYSLPVGQSPIRGGFTLSGTQLNNLWNGNWYVVVNSAAHPSGEIKGYFGCVGTCSVPTSATGVVKTYVEPPSC